MTVTIEEIAYRNHPLRCHSNFFGLSCVPIDPNAEKYYIPQKKTLSRRNKNRQQKKVITRWNREHKVTVRHGETTYKVNAYGTHQLHRIDGPARVLANGSKLWYREGLQDRRNGPACEWADGTLVYMRNGKIHRDGDEPAVIRTDSSREYHKHGRCYRWVNPDGSESPV